MDWAHDRPQAGRAGARPPLRGGSRRERRRRRSIPAADRPRAEHRRVPPREAPELTREDDHAPLSTRIRVRPLGLRARVDGPDRRAGPPGPAEPAGLRLGRQRVPRAGAEPVAGGLVRQPRVRGLPAADADVLRPLLRDPGQRDPVRGDVRGPRAAPRGREPRAVADARGAPGPPSRVALPRRGVLAAGGELPRPEPAIRDAVPGSPRRRLRGSVVGLPQRARAGVVRGGGLRGGGGRRPAPGGGGSPGRGGACSGPTSARPSDGGGVRRAARSSPRPWGSAWG